MQWHTRHGVRHCMQKQETFEEVRGSVTEGEEAI